MYESYSTINSRYETIKQDQELSQKFASDAGSLNKAGKYFTFFSNDLKINKLHFEKKFQISILKKSRMHYDHRANPVYLPVKKETKLGISSETLGTADILLQNSSRTQIVIRQTDSCASVLQKASEVEVTQSIGARFEIIETISMNQGDIFRIGKTDIRVHQTSPSLVLGFSKSKSSEWKKEETSRKFFYLGTAEEPEVIAVDDRMAAPRHALISKDFNDWKISSVDPEFKTWKYLVSMNTRKNEDSSIQSLKLGQNIQFGGSRIRLEKIMTS